MTMSTIEGVRLCELDWLEFPDRCQWWVILKDRNTQREFGITQVLEADMAFSLQNISISQQFPQGSPKLEKNQIRYPKFMITRKKKQQKIKIPNFENIGYWFFLIRVK